MNETAAQPTDPAEWFTWRALPRWFVGWRAGLIDELAARLAAAAEVEANESLGDDAPPFRRPLGWWLFRAPEARKPAMLETAQLAGLPGILTERERRIIHGDRDAQRGRCGDDARHWLLHLDEAERVLLGLPSFLEPLATPGEIFHASKSQREKAFA